jgi:hypothetical protein
MLSMFMVGFVSAACAANQCQTTNPNFPCAPWGYVYDNGVGNIAECYKLADGTMRFILQSEAYKWPIYNQTVIAPASNLSCNATKCASAGVLPVAQITQIGLDCNINSGNCGAIGVTSSITNLSYDFWWTVYYNDGSSKQICGCDGSLAKEGFVVSSANVLSSVYSFVFSPSTIQNKTISKIGFKVATLKSTNRSVWTNETLINISYGSCLNECNSVGKKHSLQGTPNHYKVCARNVSSGCFYLGSAQTCEPSHFIFNETNQNCAFSGTALTCVGSNKFCNETGVKLNNSSIKTDLNCSVPGLFCYECNIGYAFNQNLKKCMNSSCSISCTGNSYCGSSVILNSSVNTNLSCCDEQTCYTCAAGTHFYNGSCVANACVGSLPSTGTSNGTLFGANVSLTGALKSWGAVSYTGALLGACEWTCNFTHHRETNTSSGFDGCVPGAPLFCIDSDGGLNYSVKGNVSFNYLGTGPLTLFEDECMLLKSDSSGSTHVINCSGSSCMVVDYFCGADKNLNSPQFNCPNGCVDGACQLASVCSNGCAYNDGSKNICIPRGKRLSSTLNPTFCSQNKELLEQKAENSSCTSNYECLSNYCGSGKCLDLLSQESKQTGFLQKILCYLRKFFGATTENCEA